MIRYSVCPNSDLNISRVNGKGWAFEVNGALSLVYPDRSNDFSSAICALAAGESVEEELYGIAGYDRWYSSQTHPFAMLIRTLKSHCLIDYVCYLGGEKIVLAPKNAEWDIGERNAEIQDSSIAPIPHIHFRVESEGILLDAPTAPVQIQHGSGLSQRFASTLELFAKSRVPVKGATDRDILDILLQSGFISADVRTERSGFFDFHDAIFHHGSRQGIVSKGREFGAWMGESALVRKPHRLKGSQPVQEVLLSTIESQEASLRRLLLSRRSIRKHDDISPISLLQLSEFLQLSLQETAVSVDGVDRFVKPYPAAGGGSDMEVFCAVRSCEGLASGFYGYDPVSHVLKCLPAKASAIQKLLMAANNAWGRTRQPPQIVLFVCMRVGGALRKYRRIGYRNALISAGCMLQTMYLVASELGLAPCALGNGDSAAFREAVSALDCHYVCLADFALGKPLA